MRDVGGAVARGVDQVTAAHVASGRRQRKARVVARARNFNRLHGCGAHKRHPVGHGVLQRGDGNLKRVDKPSRGAPQRARCRGTGARLKFVDAVGADNRQLGHAVRQAVAAQLLQLCAVFVVKAQHHRPGAAEQKVQLLRPRTVQLAATGVDLRLYGARHRIVASVYQAAVGLRRAQRNIVSRLDHANGQVIARELPRDGASGDARADNRDIKRSVTVPPRRVDRLSIRLSYGLHTPSAAAMRRTAPQHPPTADEGRPSNVDKLVCRQLRQTFVSICNS